MFETLKNAFKNKEVRTKILITLALLFIYRLGCWIPIPGIDPAIYSTSLANNPDSLLGLISGITGNALSNGALFAIGITPYINASIILQLLTVAIPRLQEYSKQGDEGKKKITQITRYITIALAAIQSIGIVISFATSGSITTSVFGVDMPEWLVGMFVCLILITGSMFTMWLGERITDYGVGNGISLLIFVGIISSAGMAIISKFEEAFGGNEMAIWELVGFVLLVIAVFLLIVFVDLAERRVPVQYAKQIKGRKQYGGQSTYIPIKVNASGVLPIIFATAIITFPQIIAQLIAPASEGAANFYNWWNTWLGAGSRYPFYYILVALLILFFSYFYAQIQFNPEDISRNIQQYGGMINGIRPGKQTTDYLSTISKRLTLFGAIYLPSIASGIFAAVLKDATLVNAFSATGMLIVVSVALEFDKQLQSLLMMKQYKGFLK